MSAPRDSARKIFINEEAELRCGWRIAAFVLCFIVADTVTPGVVGTINVLIPPLPLTVEPSDPQEYLPGGELIYLISSRASNLIAVVAATVVCARLLERRSFLSVGFKAHPLWWRDCLLGCALGGSAIAAAIGVAKLGGAVSFEPATHNGAPIAQRSVLLAAAALALFFLIAAAFEELLFRGFAFQALVHDIGPVAALALSSVVFGAAHVSNPSATGFSTINTMLAGVWLGASYLATRSLWLATALHLSWNFVMVFVFGLPVSGLATLDRLALTYAKSGEPEWLSGGSYGPEGGLPATVVLMLATVVIWRSGVFSPTKEMLTAIRHGRPGRDDLRITPTAGGTDQINRTSEKT